tara:strand:+ start:343 stop:678 length:336 start_codon:yes stop_codon:yes gene_type:complete
MKNINQLEDERKIIIQKHDKYNSHENIEVVNLVRDRFPDISYNQFKYLCTKTTIKKRANVLRELSAIVKKTRHIKTFNFVHLKCGFNTFLPEDVNRYISSFLPLSNCPLLP